MIDVRRWLPRALGLLAFVVYVLAVPPGMYWLDSQELAAAGVRLGVAHPTGFPLFLLLARLAAWLPIGELAFRVHLVSAACGALAVWQVAVFTQEIAGDGVPALAGGLAAGLVLGASLTFFRQATVTEVYAPTALFLVVAARLFVRVARGGPGGLVLSFLAGLGAVGVHASFRLLFALPMLALLVVAWRRGARWPLAAPALAALGAVGLLLYLPLRSASGHIDALDWGHPSTLGALVEHVTAARIRRAFAADMMSGSPSVILAHLGDMAARIEEEMGVLALMAAAGGALALLLRRGGRLPGALLLFLAGGDLAYAVWLNPMGISDRQVGVPLELAVAVLAGVGAAAAGRRLGRAAPFAASAVALMLAVQPVVGGLGEKRAPGGSDAPRAWAEAALAGCPPGGVAIVEQDSTAAGLLWLGAVEGARPDVATLVRQHLWDTRRDRRMLAAIGLAWKGELWETLRGRPLRWEPGREAPPARMAADAPLAALGDVRVDAAASARRLARAFAGTAVDDENARHLALRAWINVGVAAARGGDPASAALYAERALALDPDDGLARVNAARYRLSLNEDSAARAHIEAALRAEPARAAAWSVLGILDARAGRCAEAARSLDRALALDPEEPDAKANRGRIERDCRPSGH